MSKRAKTSDSSDQRNATGRSSAQSAAAARDPIGDYEALVALQSSDKLYYRIGEVSKLTGVKAHVLRYWETEFRWMTPPKSRSKQRLYRRRDIEFVWLLKRLLWDERYTIAGARQRIQELGVDGALALLHKPAEVGAETHAQSSADWLSIRAALDEMQSELVSVRGVLQETA
jgi:DNA-binding transcriptional MerR regulator